MPPRSDAIDIGSEQYLLRVLKPQWIVLENGRHRPTSDALTDSNYENSCFVEGEITLEELRGLFPGNKFAKIPVLVIREAGFFIQRVPEEAPAGCSNPHSHVHIGPPEVVRRLEYQRQAKKIVKHPNVSIIE